MSEKQDRLVWIDLEMTGLDPDTDRIIEIATVVTDINLEIVATGPDLVIKQPKELLEGMDKWNTDTHTKSGLYAAVLNSVTSVAEAETKTLDFLSQHLKADSSPICGNSICQDRRFLYRYMPKLEKFFHYRQLDVSTLKILAKNWSPKAVPKKSKDSNHRALDDIMESIEELRHYKQHFLKI